jgi:hypothetical protein
VAAEEGKATMKKTAAGLPNTCAGCGKAVTVKQMWYAQSEQHAIAGTAFHSLQCASKHSDLSGYTSPKTQQEETEVTEEQKPATRKNRKGASSSKTKTA